MVLRYCTSPIPGINAWCYGTAPQAKTPPSNGEGNPVYRTLIPSSMSPKMWAQF